MSIKRIIPCLDIKNGRVVKGIQFLDPKDVATPTELAKKYNDSGADELVFYDITASIEGRHLFTNLLKEVISCIDVPLTAGGGIATIEDVDLVLGCGAAKVSINSGAIKNPELLGEAARKYGKECVVLAIDAKMVAGQYHIFSSGGMEDTGIDAIEWVKRGEALGAGELVVNSIDTDGVKGGFDIPMLKAISDAVNIPIVASGGAGSIADFIELFQKIPEIDAGLGASVFHFGIIEIPALKKALQENGINVKTNH